MSDSSDESLAADASAKPQAELPKQLLRKLKITMPGYKLGKVIARGGQAIVIKAVQESSGRDVAIKLLREGPLADLAARARLQREISVLAALNHPNIVTVLDHGVTPEGLDYLVMNFVEGQGLHEFINDNRAPESPRLEPALLLKLFVKICEAMNAAHLRGIVHRDLSPSNIMIDPAGEPHILDFGLARTAFDRFIGGGGRTISITGQFMGKVAYPSPEQARGEPDKIDIRTDVYALGVILYQILTGGEFPYKVVGNVIEVLGNIVNEPPTPPSAQIAARDAQQTQNRRLLRKQHPPTVNEVMEAIVLKALEKDPANRYQSSGEFGRDIENYLAGLPTIAQVKNNRYGFPRRPQPGQPRKTWLQPPKNSTLAKLNRTHAAIAGLICAAFFGAWAIFHFLNSGSPQPEATTVSALGPDASPATPAPQLGPNAPAPSSNVASPPILTASLPRDASNAQASTNPPAAIDSLSKSSLAEQRGQAADLLSTVQLNTDSVDGKWKKVADGIEGEADPSDGSARLNIGAAPVGEYDFRVKFTCKTDVHSVALLMSFKGIRFAWVMRQGSCLFDGYDSTLNKSGVKAAQTYTSLVKVRKDSISAFLDGDLVSIIKADDLGKVWSGWTLDSNTIGIGCRFGPLVIHSAEIIPVDGNVSELARTPSSGDQQMPNSGSSSVLNPKSLLKLSSEWIPLFNGTDLNEWQPDPSGSSNAPTWDVQDGVMVGHGGPSNAYGRGGGVGIRNIHPVQDFHLHFLTMLSTASAVRFIITATPNGQTSNNDLRFRATLNRSLDRVPGSIWMNGTFKVGAKAVPLEPGKWFAVDFIHDGDTLTVFIDNVQVSTYSDPTMKGVPGFIEFTGGGDTITRFKDIVVRQAGNSPDLKRPNFGAPRADPAAKSDIIRSEK